MKKRIFLHYIILIIIALAITGFFTSELTQRFYMQEVEEKLKNTAGLLEHQLLANSASGKVTDYNRFAAEYADILAKYESVDSENGAKSNTRITIIDYGGKVLGETQTDYHAMENHLSRKEVREAIAGKVGSDIRKSKTLGVDFLYIAYPVRQLDIILRVSVPLVQIKKIDQLIWYYSLLGILAGLFLTSLLAWRFSYSLIRPINELISISRDISWGNYSRRAAAGSKDELGQLARTFNEMAAKLEKTIEELTDKNIKVDSIINSLTGGIIAVDLKFRVILVNSIACELFNIKYGPGIIGMNIIELIRNNQLNAFLENAVRDNRPLTNEIIISPPQNKILRIYASPIKSKTEAGTNLGGIVYIEDITNLKKLEQIKTEFVSNVTHELKTPLTSIRGFIETLRGGAISDKEVAEKFLEIIDIEAERLYILINDILQLSEIESKQNDTNIGTYNLKSIVEEVLSILQGSAGRKNITLASDVDEKLLINANRDRIKQMLINLADNGIKYNTEGGRVLVKAGKADGKIVIVVRDTGIGIPEEHLPRIFERFYRVDKGRSRSMGGTGLGLSIVKHIVNLYNGDIKINSRPGEGTEFIIQLPL